MFPCRWNVVLLFVLSRCSLHCNVSGADIFLFNPFGGYKHLFPFPELGIFLISSNKLSSPFFSSALSRGPLMYVLIDLMMYCKLNRLSSLYFSLIFLLFLWKFQIPCPEAHSFFLIESVLDSLHQNSQFSHCVL
jgi:Zn-dependent protease